MIRKCWIEKFKPTSCLLKQFNTYNVIASNVRRTNSNNKLKIRKKKNLHSQRHPLEALAKTSPSVSSWTLADDLLESVESNELWGGEFFKCTEDRKSGATAATSSRKLRLSIPRTRSTSKAFYSLSNIRSALQARLCLSKLGVDTSIGWAQSNPPPPPRWLR